MYDATMDYSAAGMGHACEVEKTFSEFFHTVKAILRSADENANQRWEDAEKKLADDLEQVCENLLVCMKQNNLNNNRRQKVMSTKASWTTSTPQLQC